MKQCGNLRNLMDMSVEEMTAHSRNRSGESDSAASRDRAWPPELPRAGGEPLYVEATSRCGDYVMEELRYLQKEHFVCLFLNTKNHVIGQETLSMGL